MENEQKFFQSLPNIMPSISGEAYTVANERPFAIYVVS